MRLKIPIHLSIFSFTLLTIVYSCNSRTEKANEVLQEKVEKSEDVLDDLVEMERQDSIIRARLDSTIFSFDSLRPVVGDSIPLRVLTEDYDSNSPNSH